MENRMDAGFRWEFEFIDHWSNAFHDFKGSIVFLFFIFLIICGGFYEGWFDGKVEALQKPMHRLRTVCHYGASLHDFSFGFVLSANWF